MVGFFLQTGGYKICYFFLVESDSIYWDDFFWDLSDFFGPHQSFGPFFWEISSSQSKDIFISNLLRWFLDFKKIPTVLFMDGGWSFVGGNHCKGVAIHGHLGAWGRRPCGVWLSIGGHCHPCVGCGRPWGFVVICGWGMVICWWGVVVCGYEFVVIHGSLQYFTLPLLVQQTPTDFHRTLPFLMDSADSPSEVRRSLLDMTGFRC